MIVHLYNKKTLIDMMNTTEFDIKVGSDAPVCFEMCRIQLNTDDENTGQYKISNPKTTTKTGVVSQALCLVACVGSFVGLSFIC